MSFILFLLYDVSDKKANWKENKASSACLPILFYSIQPQKKFNQITVNYQ